MSNEDRDKAARNAMEATSILIQLFGIEDRINEVFFKMSEDSTLEMTQEQWEYILPDVSDFGLSFDNSADKLTLNENPIPDNADVVVYFYIDEETGHRRATLRYPQYEDNHTHSTDTPYVGAEAYGSEVIRLLHREVRRAVLNAISDAAAQTALSEVSEKTGMSPDAIRDSVRKMLASAGHNPDILDDNEIAAIAGELVEVMPELTDTDTQDGDDPMSAITDPDTRSELAKMMGISDDKLH